MGAILCLSEGASAWRRLRGAYCSVFLAMELGMKVRLEDISACCMPSPRTKRQMACLGSLGLGSLGLGSLATSTQ